MSRRVEWNIRRDNGSLVTRSSVSRDPIQTKWDAMRTEGRTDVTLVYRLYEGPWTPESTKKRLNRRCEGTCGRTLPVGRMNDHKALETVNWGPDPYQLEINDAVQNMWLCLECYAESADEI